MKLSEFDYTAAIMYPALWPVRKDAHSTMIYLTDDIHKVGYTPLDVLDVLNLFEWEMGIVVATADVEWFGENHDIPVVPLLSHTLEANHMLITAELNARGIFSPSEFSYHPHVTIEAQDIPHVPRGITLLAPELWWGTDKLK